MANIELYSIVFNGFIIIMQIFISIKLNSMISDHDKIITLEERLKNLIREHDKNHTGD